MSSIMKKSADVTSHHTLVEVELRRKTLYEELLDRIKDWESDCGFRIRLSEKEISHILLRYHI